MNDYIETPEGHRVRWVRPEGVEQRGSIVNGEVREPGVSTIDLWVAPEPPEAV